jgi:hypothetical protein
MPGASHQQLEKSLTVSEVITSVLQQAAQNFAASLDEFYPSYGSNGLNERNLTYQMSKAFAARSNAHAFMEVPFLNPVTERYEFRIDCMLFDPTTVAFVECKRLYSPEKAEQLRLDFHRMSAINLAPVLEKFTRAQTSERSVYRVMLAETWQKATVDWWTAKDSSRSWDNEWLPDERGVFEVKTFENGNTLYWLFAYEQLELA